MSFRFFRLGSPLLVLGLVMCRGTTSERPKLGEADEVLRRAMADSTNWPSYGRDYSNQRYSPLSQINTANVQSLTLAWRYATGVPHAFEASPVVIGQVMYVSTPLNHVVALEAGTGRKLWEYAESLATTIHCCGPVNRGVAVYGGRVYMGTLDARLVALDAKTGKKIWGVRVADNERGYAIDAAPVVADGRVIVGLSGAEYGIRGWVAAYDAATGAEVWRFYTIPSPEEGGLTPLEDQQLAGLIMWIPAGLAYLVATLVITASWLGVVGRKAERAIPLLLLLILLMGCASSKQEQAKKLQQQESSWQATIQLIQQLRQRRAIPDEYARQTLEVADQQLQKIRQQAGQVSE